MKRIQLMARRKAVGLSQEALAEQLGVDVSTVRRWEHGERQPQPWQRHNLATALDVTLEDLDVLLSGDAREDDDKATAGREWHRALDMSEAGLSVATACTYLAMAQEDPRLATEAEQHMIAQLASVPEGQGRAKLFGQIGLARVRLRAGEAEQACEDGDEALCMAESVSSAMVRSRLRDLLADSDPFAAVPRVVEFRDRLRGVIAGLN